MRGILLVLSLTFIVGASIWADDPAFLSLLVPLTIIVIAEIYREAA